MIELLVFPSRGVGPFILGSSREAVASIAGRPDSVELIDIADKLHEEWRYDKFHIELSFTEDDDWKLSSIGVYGSNAILNGIRFVSQPLSRLHALCEVGRIDDMRLDGDFGEFGVCYTSESLNVMLWAVDDFVTKLDIFPKYDASGNKLCWLGLENAPI